MRRGYGGCGSVPLRRRHDGDGECGRDGRRGVRQRTAARPARVPRLRARLAGPRPDRAGCDALPALSRHVAAAQTRQLAAHDWPTSSRRPILYVPANLLPVMTTTSVWRRASAHDPRRHRRAVAVRLVGARGDRLDRQHRRTDREDRRVVGARLHRARRARRGALRERARLYRMVQTVGHWSMLDVYRRRAARRHGALRQLASVRPEPGLLAFGTVVVLTMLAASSFDPRLIWARATAPMAERTPPPPAAAAGSYPQPAMTRRSRLAAVAGSGSCRSSRCIVGALLAVRTVLQTGPTITIEFHNAEGIEAGRTELRYKEVVIGRVSGVSLEPRRASRCWSPRCWSAARSQHRRRGQPLLGRAAARRHRRHQRPRHAVLGLVHRRRCRCFRRTRSAASKGSRRRRSCCAASRARSFVLSADRPRIAGGRLAGVLPARARRPRRRLRARRRARHARGARVHRSAERAAGDARRRASGTPAASTSIVDAERRSRQRAVDRVRARRRHRVRQHRRRAARRSRRGGSALHAVRFARGRTGAVRRRAAACAHGVRAIAARPGGRRAGGPARRRDRQRAQRVAAVRSRAAGSAVEVTADIYPSRLRTCARSSSMRASPKPRRTRCC